MNEVQTIDSTLEADELMELFIAGMKYYEKGGRLDSSDRYGDPRDGIDRMLVKFLGNVLKSRKVSSVTETVVRGTFGLIGRRTGSTIVLGERSPRRRRARK